MTQKALHNYLKIKNNYIALKNQLTFKENTLMLEIANLETH